MSFVEAPVQRNTAREVAPRVWLIHFPTNALINGPACVDLLPPMLASSKGGPIIMLAEPPADLRGVDLSLTTFWLSAIRVQGLRVRGMGVVTKSASVRVALRGIQLALSLTSTPIATQSFDTVDQAIAWGKTQGATS